ncbi:MAG: mannonate dehydratase [Halieaceae bacterium]
MQETWRWFGPDDTVSLEQIVQAGASGVVTALDHIPTGEAWPREDIAERNALLSSHGLEWSVVESVPVHQDIKLRKGDYQRLIENYRTSLKNLGAEGVTRVCYNFMPVVDWTRTNLDFELDNASSALRFEMTDFVAYDAFILEREGAKNDYSVDLLAQAKSRLQAMSTAQKEDLEINIIAGLPGGEGSWDREGIRAAIKQFTDLGTEGLRANLIAFLRDIIPAAEEAGVVLAIHPDDPPFSLFGLPRVVSTADDARYLTTEVDSAHNGLTMCAGSYGARSDNDLVAMVKEFGSRIQFVHLRNIKREADGSFYESEHLSGDNDIVGLVGALLSQERERADNGVALSQIPMRPDHGHAMGDEKNDPNVRPGYSYAGRMKGLAELRGVIHTISALQPR